MDETSSECWKGLEIIIVDVSKLPKQGFERYEYLKKEVVVPD